MSVAGWLWLVGCSWVGVVGLVWLGGFGWLAVAAFFFLGGGMANVMANRILSLSKSVFYVESTPSLSSSI